jgi:hypothetical protein
MQHGTHSLTPNTEPNKTLHPTATSILFVFRASISPRMS